MGGLFKNRFLRFKPTAAVEFAHAVRSVVANGQRTLIRAVIRWAALVCVITFGAAVVSCAVPAYQRIDQQAEQAGFSRSTVQGSDFRHVLYESASSSNDNDTIHIYIDGDGVNWQWNRLVKADPTPARSLMLDLMKTDNANTLYLGRPCYLGLELDPGCDADYWTYARFSENVVSSMVSVLKVKTGQYNNVVLIGHSGGAALALLIAEHLPRVAAVVTIAGVIDTDAWTGHHGYTRLVGSINPATQRALPITIRQLHLVGGLDVNTPVSLARDWIQKQPAATLWQIPENTHICCWNNNWPSVLGWLAAGD